MKASIKFREEQKPLLRAKIPLSILGFPFQSGVVAGESKELALNLATFFDSGPSLKIAYRPNDSTNPFSLVFKTGIGHFGSPISSPMTMSAEFNLIGNQNPSFFVHFRPQFGDFSIKKSQSSEFVKSIKPKSNGSVSDDDGSIEVIETPLMKSGYSMDNGQFSSKKITVESSESTQASGLISGLLSGMEASARTSLPLMNRAVVNFRWGFRFPAAAEDAVVAVRKNPIQKLPLLVMNKISIEHVAEDRPKESGKVDSRLNLPAGDEVTETCLAVKRQLEMIQSENGMLRHALDELRDEFAGGKFSFPAVTDDSYSGKGRGGRSAGGEKKPSSEMEGFGGKMKKEGDVKEELKKKA